MQLKVKIKKDNISDRDSKKRALKDFLLKRLSFILIKNTRLILKSSIAIANLLCNLFI